MFPAAMMDCTIYLSIYFGEKNVKWAIYKVLFFFSVMTQGRNTSFVTFDLKVMLLLHDTLAKCTCENFYGSATKSTFGIFISLCSLFC